jgi:hypothetical protein
LAWASVSATNELLGAASGISSVRESGLEEMGVEGSDERPRVGSTPIDGSVLAPSVPQASISLA